MTSTNPTSQQSNGSSAQPLKILIAGAGIGGLAAALSLRRSGHHVTLFEQSRLANEIGAAINIAPNCNGILRRLGLFLENHGAVDCTAFMIGSEQGQIQVMKKWEKVEETFGFPYHLMHRAHLHKALKELAVSEEGAGPKCELRAASRVLSVDPERAIVKLENGEEVQGDVIIGADGVNSRTRRNLPGATNIRPFSSGVAGYRFLIDIPTLAANPATAEYVKEPGMLLRFVSDHDKQVLVMYPCQNNEVMNCMFVVPTENTPSPGDSAWSNTTSKEQMLSIISQKWGPGPRAVLDMASSDGLRLWDLLDMDTLPTWVTGKMALLGDAAHPFTPWRGQGAAQAIEDAASLGAMLPLGTTPADIPARLDLYQKCRRDRAHAIQDMSRQNSPIKSLTAESEAKGEMIKDFEFSLLGFDEVKHSQEALDRLLAAAA